MGLLLLLTVGVPGCHPPAPAQAWVCPGRLCKAREQNKLTVRRGGAGLLPSGVVVGDRAASWGGREGHLGRLLKARLLCHGLQLQFCPARPGIVPAPREGRLPSLPLSQGPLQLSWAGRVTVKPQKLRDRTLAWRD